MGNYLSRESVLSAGIETIEVDAFGGKVMVSELDAAEVQNFLSGGMISYEGGEANFDLTKLDFCKLALAVIVDPEDPTKRLLKPADIIRLRRQSFGDVQACVMAAIEITDMGGEDEEEEGEETKN